MKSKYFAEEKFRIAMVSFAGNVTQAEICRGRGIYPVELFKRRKQFILGGKTALAQRRNLYSRDKDIGDLKRIIGDQSLVIDAFKKRSREQNDGS
jgi:transposase-like protein